jgi:hypothetical protein
MTDTVLTGPAFSKSFKVLAWALCGILLFWSLHLPIEFTSKSGLWVSSALALIFYTAWQVQISMTSLNDQVLSQTWIWNKAMALNDMAYVKIIHVPMLDWLIAPRVYARTMMGKFAVFYVSSPELLKAMYELEAKLKAKREMF